MICYRHIVLSTGGFTVSFALSPTVASRHTPERGPPDE
uniref:Uncharacterized protein n=1 Tax=Heterorhabditis bacteriophora TaxID=37862 RepID=A0A1I7XDJ5_HETBA